MIYIAVRQILSKPPSYSWNFEEFFDEADSYLVTILDNALSDSNEDTESNSPSPDEDSFQSAHPSDNESSDTLETSDPEPVVTPPPPSVLRPPTHDSVQLSQAQQFDHLLPPPEDLPPPIPRRQSSRRIENPVSNYAKYSKHGTK